MTSLVVTLTVCALGLQPGAAVILSRRTNVSPADAQAVARQAGVLLKDAGVPVAVDSDTAATALSKLGVTDAAGCAGKKACIAELGKELGVAWVVAVSVSQVDSDRAVALELLRTADQAVVEKDSFILEGKAKMTEALVSSFAGRVKAAIGPMALLAVRPPDAPVQHPLDPTPVPPPPPLAPSAAPPKAHVTAYVLGTSGAVAVGAGVALLAVGLSTRGQLSAGAASDGVIHSDMMGSQAVALNRRANLELGVAAAVAAAGLGLGTAAVFTW